MEHTTNRTFICSVVFLDIVEYSQQPVDEQIRLKTRFNNILAEAIKDVAVNDRIILDTGDGAAISFLGDPEDALFVGLSIRDAIFADCPSCTPRLSARIGINLGPVKLVQDINGQRNLIGDGINVAQRVMSFAKPGQILVSRSFFEVISRLSQEYAKLFHYEGSRADKHVREHQVYSVYPEEKKEVPPPPSPKQQKEEPNKKITGGDLMASTPPSDSGGQAVKSGPVDTTQPHRPPPPSFLRIGLDKISSLSGAVLLGSKKMIEGWSVKPFNWNAIRNNPTALYSLIALIVILISVPVIIWITGGQKAQSPAPAPPVNQQGTDTAAATPVTEGKTDPGTTPANQAQTATEAVPEKPAAPATIFLGISPWGEVYLDGNKEGVSPPLNTLQVKPGKHQIEIRNAAFPSYKQEVDLKPGEQFRIKHKFN